MRALPVRQRLDELEAVIERGMHTFVEVGEALTEIRDTRLYALSGSPGFPDLVAVRGERVLFVELKAQKGTLRDEQKEWLGDLGLAPGVEAHCWRPADWPVIEGLIR